jgi:hypothetical protein
MDMVTATTSHSYISMTEAILEQVPLVKRGWHDHDILRDALPEGCHGDITSLSHREAKGPDYISVYRGRSRVRSFDQTKPNMTFVATQHSSVYCTSPFVTPMLLDRRSIGTGIQIPCGYASSRLHRPVLFGCVATSVGVYFVTDIVLCHRCHHSLSGDGVRRFAYMPAHGSNESYIRCAARPLLIRPFISFSFC